MVLILTRVSRRPGFARTETVPALLTGVRVPLPGWEM